MERERLENARKTAPGASSSSLLPASSIDLTGAQLEGVSIGEEDLAGVSFAGADLRGASFAGTDLRSANFESSDLSGTSFLEVDLRGAYLYDLGGHPKAAINGQLKTGHFG